MGKNLIGAALAAILCLMPNVLAVAGEEPVPLKTVLHKVEGYLRSIQYVECKYTEVGHSLPSGLTLERQYEFRADMFGREYCSYHDKGGGTCYAWNGVIMKTLTDEPQGIIEKRPPGGLIRDNPVVAALDFITNNGGTLKGLHTTPSSLVSVEKTEDDEIYAVKFEMFAPTTDVPGGSYATVWFSRRRGFAPVRRTDYLNGKLLGEGSYELQEIAPGIWLPVRVTGKGYLDYERSAPGKLVEVSPVPTGITTSEVEPGSYKVNIPDTKGKFDLTFPNGVKVIDMVTGQTYVTGADVKPPDRFPPPRK